MEKKNIQENGVEKYKASQKTSAKFWIGLAAGLLGLITATNQTLGILEKRQVTPTVIERQIPDGGN